MKKIKMLLVLLGLGLFMFAGVSVANAATISNVNIVCEPTTLEKGDTGKCYVIANVQAQNGNGIHGVITRVSTTDLDITKWTAGVGSNLFVAARATNGQTFQNRLTAEAPKLSQDAINYECATTGEVCYGFFTADSTGNGAFTHDNSGVESLGNIEGNTGYTVIGQFDVKLAETASEGKCGSICLTAEAAAAAADYKSLVSATTKQVCAEISPKETFEPTPVTPPENPDTGAFASIAVLAAGALIAIGAIAVAKKNNKFYRV